jgi:26S proteasome regulatory subunit N3
MNPEESENKNTNTSSTGSMPSDSNDLFLTDIKRCVDWIEKGSKEKNSRFIARALRSFLSLRRRLVSSSLLLPQIVNSYVASPRLVSLLREALNGMDLGKIPSSDTDMTDEASQNNKMETEESEATEQSWTHIYSREVEVFIAILCMAFLIDRKELHRGLVLSTAWVDVLKDENRRSLDLLAARVYFYFVRFYELTGQSRQIRG